MFKLNTQTARRAFKRHTVLIEDRELRDRLTLLEDSTSTISDPFANDIMWHHSCWRKYISQTQFAPDDAIHLQEICLTEARICFFRQVDEVIFTEREIHLLQSLLSDYKRIVNDYGCAVIDVRSPYYDNVPWNSKGKPDVNLNVIFKFPWNSIEVQWNLLLIKMIISKFRGIPWNSVVFDLAASEFHEIPWNTMEPLCHLQWCPPNSMVIFNLSMQGFHGISWNIPWNSKGNPMVI